MADIKTRDVVKGTIKKIDKAAIAADRMRSAYVQTKEKAEHAIWIWVFISLPRPSVLKWSLPPAPPSSSAFR